MSRMYAIIHRAAYDYYYNNPFGIQSPPKNSWYNDILSIAAFNWEDMDSNGDAAPWRRWSGTAEIRIFKPSRAAKDLYATTIHELAHTSHWDLAGRFKYYTADNIVCESWARGVQWEFTRRIYTNYTVYYSRRDYTGVVQDLIDGLKLQQVIGTPHMM